MKHLLYFEKYLSGGNQPLYHYMWGTEIENIIKTDKLEMEETAGGKFKQNAICLTRNSNYDELESGDRIVLDVDLLKKDGINPRPIDEVQYVSLKNRRYIDLKKSNPNSTLKGIRYTKMGQLKLHKNPNSKPVLIGNNSTVKPNTEHSFDIKNKSGKILKTMKGWNMELEFEERIYQNIKNIGKYILFMDLNTKNPSQGMRIDLKQYLEKYPQIKIRYKRENPNNPEIINI